ncbi:MAG: biotin--[acetyl-CoA-carboxylase] ligase [bacterium]|nr:biotin--[acetyl-CoA-carboxylase] ligase [bacterium]
MDVREISGIKVFFLEETTSTMDVARDFHEKENEFVIVAKKQTRGRGRQGRVWISDEGGLWLSVVWHKIDQNLMKYLFIISAISIIETLKIYGISAKIKFPNDIYIGSKKIAGILIENLKDCVIIGIGINVNNRIEDKMDESISCRSILGQTLDLDIFLSDLLINLEKVRNHFKKDSQELLNKIKGFLIE